MSSVYDLTFCLEHLCNSLHREHRQYMKTILLPMFSQNMYSTLEHKLCGQLIDPSCCFWTWNCSSHEAGFLLLVKTVISYSENSTRCYLISQYGSHIVAEHSASCGIENLSILSTWGSWQNQYQIISNTHFKGIPSVSLHCNIPVTVGVSGSQKTGLSICEIDSSEAWQ